MFGGRLPKRNRHRAANHMAKQELTKRATKRLLSLQPNGHAMPALWSRWNQLDSSPQMWPVALWYFDVRVDHRHRIQCGLWRRMAIQSSGHRVHGRNVLRWRQPRVHLRHVRCQKKFLFFSFRFWMHVTHNYGLFCARRFGRRPALTISCFFLACFMTASAFVSDITTFIVFRFFGGIFYEAIFAISFVWGNFQSVIPFLTSLT